MSLSPDLTHADWWIRTCTKLLQKVDTSLRFTVVKVEKTQHLVIENISETTLSQLFFLVNTDQNNNYGYLEELQVFVKDDYSRTAIPIPGFSTLANAIWNEADATGFVEGQKTQTAFLAPLNNPYTDEALTIPEYVDWITAVIPWAPKTFGKEKIFTLMLNPDKSKSDDSDDPPLPPGSVRGTVYHYPPQYSSRNLNSGPYQLQSTNFYNQNTEFSNSGSLQNTVSYNPNDPGSFNLGAQAF